MKKLIQSITAVICLSVIGSASAVQLATAIGQSPAVFAQKMLAAKQAYINANVPCIQSILNKQIPAISKTCTSTTQLCIGNTNSIQQCTQACQNAINTINSGHQLTVNRQPNGGGAFNPSTANLNDNNIDECNNCSQNINQASHGALQPYGCTITPFKTPS